jgi:hypothetical protein
MKVLFYILTCKKYYDTRLKAIKETYLKRIVPPNDFIFLSDNFGTFEDKTISFDVDNSYESAGIKFKHLIKHLYNNMNDFDYYVCCDDDTYIFIDRFLKYIEPFKSYDKPICICNLFHIKEGDDPKNKVWGDNCKLPIEYPQGGSGFIYNNKALIQVGGYLNSNSNPPMSSYGDISHGFWFRESGVALIKTDLLKAYTPEMEKHSDKMIKEHLSYHYLKPEDFYGLEKFN